MIDLSSPELLRNPYPLYAHLRATTPVLTLPGVGVALFDHESVRRALTDHECFGSGVAEGQPATWLIFSDPPRHARLRALVSRAFTPKSVAALEPRVRALSATLLEGRSGAGEMDLVGDYAAPLPLMVIAEMLGAPAGDHRLFRRWGDATLALVHTIEGGAAGKRAQREFLEVSREMERYLAALDRGADDLLSRLRAAEIDGQRLSEAEILGFFQLLLLAGHETTTNLIANAVLCLIENPPAMELVQTHPERLAGLVEEVLRYRSPVQVAFRVTRCEVILHGQTLATGTRVLAVIGSANRDPAQFPEPDRFDLERRATAHAAFGHGIHFCLGAALARLEARVALGDLMTRLPRLSLANDGPWQPRPAFHVHGPARLPIRA